jgi:ppGpp synthetase/RelA/SpoT-type nucleotidyltranferase
MNESTIEYSAVTSRAKSLNSFAEKISRKQYVNPLQEITDLAGVRLVFLYKSDRQKIEKIIESEFEIIEKLDKVEEQDDDRFGYGALHYLIRLGRKSSGARYDDLKSLICEIQVRTVLQDAWAIIDHHLIYKQEAEVPKLLKRKLNSLSGLFETADDQFDRVRVERLEYRKTVKNKLSDKADFLNQEIDLDTYTEFLKLKFPEKRISGGNAHLSRTLRVVIDHGFSKLHDLDQLLSRTEKARKAMNTELPTSNAAAEVVRAIAFTDPSYRKDRWPENKQEFFKKYEKLVVAE